MPFPTFIVDKGVFEEDSSLPKPPSSTSFEKEAQLLFVFVQPAECRAPNAVSEHGESGPAAPGSKPIQDIILWTKSASHHLETMGNPLLVGIYRKKHIIPRFVQWCLRGFRPSTAPDFELSL